MGRMELRGVLRLGKVQVGRAISRESQPFWKVKTSREVGGKTESMTKKRFRTGAYVPAPKAIYGRDDVE